MKTNKSDTQIIIIDDNTEYDAPLIVELQMRYENVLLYTKPKKALAELDNFVTKKSIIILDIMFNSKQPNGHETLEEIRKKTHLIHVILWSAVNETKETFSDFINHHAFAFVKQGASYTPLLDKVEKADEHLNNSMIGMLEEWIEIRNRNKKYDGQPYMVEANGKSYTLEELMEEVRLQTPVGQKFIKGVHMLSMDLLLRKKVKLED